MPAIDEYLKNITPAQKAEWLRLRKIVKALVPEAEETVSYGMPSLKYKGKILIYFGAFKNHMSLFPTSEPIESMKQELAPYIASKGTLRFTEDNPIPDNIIIALIKHRLASFS